MWSRRSEAAILIQRFIHFHASADIIGFHRRKRGIGCQPISSSSLFISKRDFTVEKVLVSTTFLYLTRILVGSEVSYRCQTLWSHHSAGFWNWQSTKNAGIILYYMYRRLVFNWSHVFLLFFFFSFQSLYNIMMRQEYAVLPDGNDDNTLGCILGLVCLWIISLTISALENLPILEYRVSTSNAVTCTFIFQILYLEQAP